MCSYLSLHDYCLTAHMPMSSVSDKLYAPITATVQHSPLTSLFFHTPTPAIWGVLTIACYFGKVHTTCCLHTAKLHSHPPHLLPSPPPCRRHRHCRHHHYHCPCSTPFCPAPTLAAFGRCIYVQTCPRLAFLSTTIMSSSPSPLLLLVFCSVLPSTDACHFW